MNSRIDLSRPFNSYCGDNFYCWEPVKPDEWGTLVKGQALLIEVKIEDELIGPSPCVLLENKMLHPTETGLKVRLGIPVEKRPEDIEVTVLAIGITRLFRGTVTYSAN
jgi:hypothetical protein